MKICHRSDLHISKLKTASSERDLNGRVRSMEAEGSRFIPLHSPSIPGNVKLYE